MNNHCLSKLVNEVYFGVPQDTEYGYKLFSRYSKHKFKHVVQDESDIDKYSLSGEILCAKPFSEGNITLKETFYNLKDLFNPDLYSCRKSFKKRVLYPLKTKLDVEILTEKDIPECIRLHDKWVEEKLKQPHTFKMMFSSTRYKKALNFIKDSNFLFLKISENGAIKGFRVFGKEEGCLMDITNISAFWEKSQLSESVIITTYDWLLKHGYEHINLGLADGISKLKFFKHSYPYTEVHTYRKIVEEKGLFG